MMDPEDCGVATSEHDEVMRSDVVYDILVAAALCLLILIGMLNVFYVYETVERIRVAILVLGVCSSGMLFGVLACLGILHRRHAEQPLLLYSE